MNAREQARAAVRYAYGNGYPEHAEIAVTYHKYADAASDVWEPLVRQALSLYEELGTELGNQYNPDNAEKRLILWARLKEAIGDADSIKEALGEG